MQQAKVRYGRPKGSGLDDRAQLAAIAALLTANPKLKPTTAIRSLGVEDPSDIRRLRDKFRMEQGTLLADAHRTPAPRSTPQPLRVCAALNENAPAAVVHRVTASPLPVMLALPPPAPQPAAPAAPAATGPAATAPAVTGPAVTGPFAWYEMGFAAINAAIENQAMLAQCFMHLPAVAMTMRAQIAMNAVAVAACQRGGRHAFARR